MSSQRAKFERARTAGNASAAGRQKDMSEAWFDLCCSMVEDLRAEVTKLRSEVAYFHEEHSVMRDCLSDQGIMTPVRFEVQMHRRRFAASAVKHGLFLQARWADILEIKEIFLVLGSHLGPSTLVNICAGSRSSNTATSPILKPIKDTAPGDIYVCGGSRDGVQGGLNTVERFDAVKGAWEILEPMVARREFGSTGIIDGKVYICGGRAGTQPLSSVECYDPTKGTWEQIADMLFARAGASAAVVSGKLYVCGGWRGTAFFNSVEYFNPLTHAWHGSPSMQVSRGDPAAAALNGRLYICGGYDGSQQLRSVENFNPQTQTWEHQPRMRERRMGLTAAASMGRLYACGGSSGTRALSSAEVFIPEARAWNSLPPMSAGRFCASATSTGGKLFVFGGMFVGRCLDSAECYDPTLGMWFDIPSMSERRTGATVAARLA